MGWKQRSSRQGVAMVGRVEEPLVVSSAPEKSHMGKFRGAVAKNAGSSLDEPGSGRNSRARRAEGETAALDVQVVDGDLHGPNLPGEDVRVVKLIGGGNRKSSLKGGPPVVVVAGPEAGRFSFTEGEEKNADGRTFRSSKQDVVLERIGTGVTPGGDEALKILGTKVRATWSTRRFGVT